MKTLLLIISAIIVSMFALHQSPGSELAFRCLEYSGYALATFCGVVAFGAMLRHFDSK